MEAAVITWRGCPVNKKQEKRLKIRDIMIIEHDNGQDKIIIQMRRVVKK